jgi:hypothetical protein
MVPNGLDIYIYIPTDTSSILVEPRLVLIIITLVTCNDEYYWHIFMYKISMNYLSVFIYFNLYFLVFWMVSPMLETPTSLDVFPHSCILASWKLGEHWKKVHFKKEKELKENRAPTKRGSTVLY